MNLQEIKETFAKQRGYPSFKALLFLSEPEVINNIITELMSISIDTYVNKNKLI